MNGDAMVQRYQIFKQIAPLVMSPTVIIVENVILRIGLEMGIVMGKINNMGQT